MKQQLLNNLHRVAALLLVCLCSSVSAKDDFTSIDLTFTPTGDATTLESVTITNLSHTEIEPITINGTDVLRLVSPETITPIESIEEAKGIAQPILTPNPSLGDGTLIFDAQEEGPVRVSIYNQGGMLLDAATLNVSKGRNTARIPAQGTGIFIVCLEGQGLKTTTRWICAGAKSFSGIALGGAGQWADVVLPMKYEAPMPTRAAQVKQHFMEYNKGDVLRFDGRSGPLRTITHMTPRVSGSVCIDLFRCQDAAGYYYPIVRSGNMLWMMEDLRPLAVEGITRTTMPSLWKSTVSKGPAVLVTQGKAYYNLEGARLALPEGWHLPSVDELRSYIYHGLHCYVYSPDDESPVYTAYHIADLMKDRSSNWGYLSQDPDSIHLQLRPNGYVNAEGKVLDAGKIGAWLLRNTIKHGHPATFEVSKEHHRFDFAVEHERDMGFTVRGCCHAPTEYEEIVNKFFVGQDDGNQPMPLANGPLGEYYTFGPERYSVFLDYTGTWNTQDTEGEGSLVIHPYFRNAILHKEDDTPDWIGQEWEANYINDHETTNHLRKVTARVNADGYEDVLYASWSRPFRVHYTDNNQYTDTPSVAGDGVVYIAGIGDSVNNHNWLFDKKPLLDKDGNQYIWNMPKPWQTSNAPWIQEPASGWILSDFMYQHYARAFNLNCIQDLNGDGVDEIVMNVGNMMGVFDGVTLRCIHQRSDFKDGCTRFDVADVTGDGYEDIVVASSDARTYTWVYIYDKGNIDAPPIFYKRIAKKSWFCDVKVGRMSRNNMPEIAVLMRGCTNNSNGTIQSVDGHGFLHVFRLHKDDNNQLQTNDILLTQVNCFPTEPYYTGLSGNLNLVFGYFRGHQYDQDLIVGDGLWRWDNSQEKPVYQFQILPRVRTPYQANWLESPLFTISADAIVAVQSRKDDKETLLFFEDHYPYCDRTNHRIYTKLCERWLADDGKTVKANEKLYSTIFANYSNKQTIRELNTNTKEEYLVLPVICKFADRDMTKHFEYVGHEQSLSEPIIFAALAAAPFYTEAGAGSSYGTSWGKSESTSDSELKSDTWGGSLIVGYEFELSMPFFSSVNAGIEFTAKVGASYSTAHGEETVVSYGNYFQAGEEHQVLLKARLYDTYTYRILSSGDPDDLGMTFQVSMPGESSFVNMSLSDYVLLMGNQWGVPEPQRVLSSTPGDPWSYPSSYGSFPCAIMNNDKLPFLKGRMGNSENCLHVGTGNGADTRTISLEQSVSQTKTVEFEVETELVSTVNGAKAGVGFNYGNSKETTRTIGSELSVEGTVPNLPSGFAFPGFYWNLVWYYVNDGGHIYPVVNYIVSNKPNPQ